MELAGPLHNYNKMNDKKHALNILQILLISSFCGTTTLHLSEPKTYFHVDLLIHTGGGFVPEAHSVGGVRWALLYYSHV